MKNVYAISFAHPSTNGPVQQVLWGFHVIQRQNVYVKPAFNKAVQYSFLCFPLSVLGLGWQLLLKLSLAWNEAPETGVKDKWWTGRGCFHCSFFFHVRSSQFGSGATLLVMSPEYLHHWKIYFTEGFTTLSSGPCPAVVNQSFLLIYFFFKT